MMFVAVGDTIEVNPQDGFLKGHGTQVVNGELVATVCGVVERVNKLISVRPLQARYNPGTGDVVIGRVTEVAQKRWKVDVNSKQDAQLMLSAVNLPGGIQRRRTAVDELNMRMLYEENDLISAEVQAVNQDGSVHLHTRSLKYGKLEKGQLIKVPSYLIKRLSQHFHKLNEYEVDVIFGCNGHVWIGAKGSDVDGDGAADAADAAAVPTAAAADGVIVRLEIRERICRLANAVRVLSKLGMLIFPDSVIGIYQLSISAGIDIKDMLSSQFIKILVNNKFIK